MPSATVIAPEVVLPMRKGPATLPPAVGGTGETSPAVPIAACAEGRLMKSTTSSNSDKQEKTPQIRQFAEQTIDSSPDAKSGCNAGWPGRMGFPQPLKIAVKRVANNKVGALDK
jgi:hypothetical protein